MRKSYVLAKKFAYRHLTEKGICQHPDFQYRIAGFRDYVGRRREKYDDNGHGTHVAGIIGGSGYLSNGKYAGLAPACHFFGCKVLDQRGNGNTHNVIDAIHWLMEHQEEYRLRIINISVGMVLGARNEERIALLKAVEEAWDSDIVVVAAAGNNGPGEGSVTIPGISRKIITVGCYDDNMEEVRNQGLKPEYSGRGPTECCIIKPELVACGTNIISCAENKTGYAQKSGTSMAAPVITGAIALLLSKYPYFQPRDVKLRLYERAVDLGLPSAKQGWGTVDMARLL